MSERTPAERAAILKRADEELVRFERWFSAPISEGGAGNSPLSRPEKAILKTYMVARIAELFPSALTDETTAS